MLMLAPKMKMKVMRAVNSETHRRTQWNVDQIQKVSIFGYTGYCNKVADSKKKKYLYP